MEQNYDQREGLYKAGKFNMKTTEPASSINKLFNKLCPDIEEVRKDATVRYKGKQEVAVEILIRHISIKIKSEKDKGNFAYAMYKEEYKDVSNSNFAIIQNELKNKGYKIINMTGGLGIKISWEYEAGH